MYEARQNKEKISRIISLKRNKEVKPINGNIVKKDTMWFPKKINRPSIQKMVVYDGEKEPVDMNVIATLPNIKDSCHGPIYNNNDIYSYEKEKKIGILAHGAPTIINWKGDHLKGEDFAKQELEAKGIKSGATLEIWSCFAGSEGENNAVPLVDTIKKHLENSNINIKIKGVIGAHVVLNDKNEHYSLNEGKEKDFIELRNRLLVETGFFPATFPQTDYEKVLSNLKELWEFEKDENYDSYVERKRRQWLIMCEKIRNDEKREDIIGNPIPNIWHELEETKTDVSF